MNRILVVNVNWVGDVVFSIPVFRTLKEHYPGAKISCLTVPRVKEVLECSPDIDDIIIYDEEGRDQFPWGKAKLITQIKQRQFDACFLLHRSLTRALLVFLARVPIRVGYNTKNRGFLLTHKIPEPPPTVHRSDYYSGLLEGYGLTIQDRRCHLEVPPQVEREITEILRKKGLNPPDDFIVIHAAGNWDLKRWPQERFALLTRDLMRHFSQKVILTGSKEDSAMIENIVRGSQVDAVNLAGETNLKQLLALMKKARLVISADSGPLHMASSVGANILGLFGPTRPEVTGPRGAGRFKIIQKDVVCNQRPCYHLTCQDNLCMQSIEVKDVLKTIEHFRN